MDKYILGSVADGYHDSGRKFHIIGDTVTVNGMEWTPIIYEDEEDPDWLKTKAVKIIPVKTSAQWYKEIDHIITIIDADGWDRNNWDYSWSEAQITKEEFKIRLTNCTVQCKKDAFAQLEKW